MLSNTVATRFEIYVTQNEVQPLNEAQKQTHFAMNDYIRVIYREDNNASKRFYITAYMWQRVPIYN